MIYCYDGLVGSGKSMAMFDHAFKLIEREKRDGLVTNQIFNQAAIERYAIKRRMWHLYKVARAGKLYYDRNTDLQTMLSYKNAVVLLDEVGIFCNRRDWADLKRKSPRFMIDLTQSRKIGVDLIWAAQAYDYADEMLRGVTNYFTNCQFYRDFHFWVRQTFAGEQDFKKWRSTGKWFKLRIALKWGFLDEDLCACYDTNTRLEDPNFKGNEIPQSASYLEHYGWDRPGDYLCVVPQQHRRAHVEATERGDERASIDVATPERLWMLSLVDARRPLASGAEA